MPRPGNVIDLPVSPLRSTAEEGNLLNAPVAATLMNGKTVMGRLVNLDSPRALLTLHNNDKGRTIIKFSELRQLNFIGKHSADSKKHPLEQQTVEVSMPRAVEAFHVTFSDGRSLSGHTRGSYVNNLGLHFFQLVGSSYISRLFIPSQVISQYHIGDRRPGAIAPKPKKGLEPLHHPATPQPLRRRRKTDKGSDDIALNSMQLEQTFEQQSNGSFPDPRQIGAMLVEDNVITPRQLESALKTQRRSPSKKLGEILVNMGVVSAEDIYRILAHKFGLPFVLLRNFYIDLECLNLVPAELARKYTLIPLMIHHDRLVVAMDDPGNNEALTLLRFITHYNVEPVVAVTEDIQWMVRKYYGGAKGTEGGSSHAEKIGRDQSPPKAGARSAKNLTADKPIVSFVQNTLLDAIRRSATDIHLVPRRGYVGLLFRIDGELLPIRRFSKVIYPKVLNRLKVMGGMDPRESRRPQHGRCSLADEDHVFNLDVEVAPAAQGETVLIRLIDTGNTLRSIGDLGLNVREAQVLAEMLNKTHSLFVTAGPEGSDRTPALYAALKTLREQNLRILTVEDPVSCHLSGIDQVQLGHSAGQTYAGVLRRMELKDTEVLMIDAISDQETAKTAIECTLRGHLVLAGLDADNAVDAVRALVRLGVDPAVLKSSLSGVLAQRVLRLNCDHCLERETIDPAIREKLGVGSDELFYHGAGCEFCNSSGFQGRLTIFELLQPTAELHALLKDAQPPAKLTQQAINDGMIPLIEHAIKLARARRTSLTEVYRNTPRP